MRTHSPVATVAAPSVGISLLLTSAGLLFAVLIGPEGIGGCRSEPAGSPIPARALRTAGLSAAQFANAGAVIAGSAAAGCASAGGGVCLGGGRSGVALHQLANDGRGSV